MQFKKYTRLRSKSIIEGLLMNMQIKSNQIQHNTYDRYLCIKNDT
jgi:hypothetical protein